jgi:hypothetical protein
LDDGNIVTANATSPQVVSPDISQNTVDKLKLMGFETVSIPTWGSEEGWFEAFGIIYGTHEQSSIFDDDFPMPKDLEKASVLELGRSTTDALEKSNIEVAKEYHHNMMMKLAMGLNFHIKADEYRKKNQQLVKALLESQQSKIRDLMEQIKDLERKVKPSQPAEPTPAQGVKKQSPPTVETPQEDEEWPVQEERVKVYLPEAQINAQVDELVAYVDNWFAEHKKALRSDGRNLTVIMNKYCRSKGIDCCNNGAFQKALKSSGKLKTDEEVNNEEATEPEIGIPRSATQ